VPGVLVLRQLALKLHIQDALPVIPKHSAVYSSGKTSRALGRLQLCSVVQTSRI